jgi:hypothetical protein
VAQPKGGRGDTIVPPHPQNRHCPNNSSNAGGGGGGNSSSLEQRVRFFWRSSSSSSSSSSSRAHETTLTLSQCLLAMTIYLLVAVVAFSFCLPDEHFTIINSCYFAVVTFTTIVRDMKKKFIGDCVETFVVVCHRHGLANDDDGGTLYFLANLY